MEILRGISVTPGIAIGTAVILDAEDYRIPFRSVKPDRVEGELARLDKAFEDSIAEIEAQSNTLRSDHGIDAANVFQWHVGVLRDARLRESIEELIRERLSSAAYATSTVMRKYQRRFLQMRDPLLVERIRDVQDIERRLLRNILGESREDLAHLTKPAILIAHDLTPTQTAQLQNTMVVGVALDIGASTSHTAILLRSWGKASVIGLGDVSTRISGGDTVIVDGSNRLVIVRPNKATLEEYRGKEAAFAKLTGELDELRNLPAVTSCGERVMLMSNIEFPREAGEGAERGSDGVGLFRTEFLFLRSGGAPSEEEQMEAYAEAIRGAAGKPITIRTFDLGADKYTQQQQYEQERNPMLGLRSIRYSLKNLDMFKIQLRAILRAASGSEVRVMFPLINSLLEFRQAKMTLFDAMEDLEDAGIPFSRDIQVGMMLETPAAALQVREFAREVDFVSIGTNDLVQYLLAVDRGNERVSQYYTPAHPSVLRALRDVIRTCTRAGIGVTLCGEMAGQPLYTLLLLGMGLRSFSMAPANIPEIKKLVRLVDIKQAVRVARRSLSFDTDRQVMNYLRDQTRKVLPEDPI